MDRLVLDGWKASHALPRRVFVAMVPMVQPPCDEVHHGRHHEEYGVLNLNRH